LDCRGDLGDWRRRLKGGGGSEQKRGEEEVMVAFWGAYWGVFGCWYSYLHILFLRMFNEVFIPSSPFPVQLIHFETSSFRNTERRASI
jgi:hypothetical protein